MTIQKPIGAAPSKKAQREARKLRNISLKGGTSVKANPTGRDRRHINQPQDDPCKAAREARARVFGLDADKQDPLHHMRGTQAGNCIADQRDALDLWGIWQAIGAALRNYRTRITGVTGDPKCATVAMTPDAMQTDQSLTVDIRTAEEKDAAAKRAWPHWESRIKALPAPQLRWAISNALDGGMDGMGGELYHGGKATDRGRVFVLALRGLKN